MIDPVNNLAAEAAVSAGRWYVRHAPGSLGKAPLAAEYLNAHLRDHPRRRVVRSRSGAKLHVDTWDLIQRYIYMFGVWEPHMTRWLRNRLRPGDTFVDVGANIGYFSVLASQLVGDGGRVVAIEASPVFHEKLLEQVRLNDCGNIRAVNTAVSSGREKLTFALASSHNMGANSMVPYDGLAESSFSIEAQPLSELLSPAEVASVRVIKVDVEGAEGAVIRGMASLLDKLRPDAEVTVEVTPDRMAKLGDSVDELLSVMGAHGFHTYRLLNDYSAESYPAALRHTSSAPERLRGPIASESDLVFSRIDAERLR